MEKGPQCCSVANAMPIFSSAKSQQGYSFLCAQGRQSFQASSTSVHSSLCTASNSTLAPVSSRHRQPQPLELLLSQPPPLESASIFEAARFCCTYCYCLWCATMYKEGLFPSMPLVFQCTYTTIRSGSLGCVLTAQGCTKGSRAVRQSGSRAVAFGQTSQLLQHDQIGERNGCPFVQIQSRSQQVNSFFLYCTSFLPTNICSELLGFL